MGRCDHKIGEESKTFLTEDAKSDRKRFPHGVKAVEGFELSEMIDILTDVKVNAGNYKKKQEFFQHEVVDSMFRESCRKLTEHTINHFFTLLMAADQKTEKELRGKQLRREKLLRKRASPFSLHRHLLEKDQN